MQKGSIAVAASLCCALTISARARADSMDPALERLVHDASGPTVPCSDGGHIRPGAAPCVYDDAAFKKIINQYGFAFAPPVMHPARTTGFGGIQIGVQAGYTTIDDGADYWKNGTRGAADPNTGQNSIRNNSPDPWLQVYNLNVRKGFPFGFELGGNIGYMAKTSIMSGGADIRWALLEGFRTGILGVLPDISIGGGVRTITGTSQFQLSVASVDGVVSKPIPIADSSVITPLVGYQFIRIFGDSGLIDPTPATDAIGYCNYKGQRVPGGWAGDDGTGTYNGQPICGDRNNSLVDGSPADLNNTKIFQKVRITRHRLVAGISYRYEMIVLGAQFITDVIDPGAANDSETVSDADCRTRTDEACALKGVPRQNTIALQIATAF